MGIDILSYVELQVQSLLDSSAMQCGGFARRIMATFGICAKIVEIDKIVDFLDVNILYFSSFIGMNVAN